MSISLNVLPCCFVISSINLSILSVTEINLSDSKPIVRIISNLYDLVLKCFICLVPLPQVIYALNQYFACDAIMGRTIPSYRLAAERERRKWKIFRQEFDCWWDLLSLGFMAQCPPTSILYLLESYKIFTVIIG